MRISRVGGLIAAGNQANVVPMLQIGTIPIIKRIVISFRQAGIFPIVVVTGAYEVEVRYELANQGVIFLSDECSEQSEQIDALKRGLMYLQGKCERVAFTPVNAPMFTPATLMYLIDAQGDVVTPFCNGRNGHPVIISENAIEDILNYNGTEGLRGALREIGSRRKSVNVDDMGVLLNIHDLQRLQEQLTIHNDSLLHPMIHLRLERETPFFDSRLKLLLFLIADTNNVRKACDAMAISYGKAWSILNNLEKELGFPVVERHQGGHHGGNTRLTNQGMRFLQTWQIFEEGVFQFAQKQFQKLFSYID